MAEGGTTEALSSLPTWMQILFSIGTLLAAILAGLYGALKKRGSGAAMDVGFVKSVETLHELLEDMRDLMREGDRDRKALMMRIVESNEEMLKLMHTDQTDTLVERQVTQRMAERERNRMTDERRSMAEERNSMFGERNRMADERDRQPQRRIKGPDKD